MTGVLVDSNVLLDVLTEDERWFEWSSEALSRCADASVLAINPIIYAEISIRFRRIEDLEEALPPPHFECLPLPWARRSCAIGGAGASAERRFPTSTSERTRP